MSNTITAYFKGRIGVAESVYQNDYGIVMAFDSIDLPAHFDCYFSVTGSNEAIPGIGADNRVTIPNSVLAKSGKVEIHIPLHTGESDSEVEYVVYFKVIGRARPEDDGTPEQMTAIEQALALLQTPIGNIEEIVNEALSFTGETFDEMQEDLATWKGGVEEGLDTWRSGVDSDIDSLDAQFQTAIAAVTSDTEVTNIRVGDNGLTYTSAGEAVRDQFANARANNREIMAQDFGISESTIIAGYSDSNATTTIPANAPFVFAQIGVGAIITAIKLKVSSGGKLSIGYVPEDFTTKALDLSKLVITNEINITSTGKQTVVLPSPFAVPDGYRLCFGHPDDTCIWFYGANSGGADHFWYYNRNYSSWVYHDNSVGVDIIGLPIVDYSYIANNYPSTKSIVDILANEMVKDQTFYDGYNASNPDASSSTTAPFMVVPKSSGYVNSVELAIRTIGTLSIGTIKARYVVSGQTFDFSKVNVHEVMTFAQTGHQTYRLASNMKVESDELIVLNVRTDTAQFSYGSSGNDIYFYYVSGTTVYYHNSKGLGISFRGIKLNPIDGEPSSTYKNKKLSILGDSISTFDGYIPSGNATYYPSGTVQAVSDTWWYKLYTALEMTIETNNSWSGSRVTTTNGDTSAGCMTRCQSLGTSPDVIIVWMGINDFNNEVALGTYDGTTALPNTTTTFREAYAIMLNKILTQYQSSEVWVCTLPQCERNAESGFPEINGNGVALAEFNKAILELANAFGVKVLDHNKCGLTYQNMPTYNPDNLHPNKEGHSLIANNDIRQMDNVVRTRY